MTVIKELQSPRRSIHASREPRSRKTDACRELRRSTAVPRTPRPCHGQSLPAAEYLRTRRLAEQLPIRPRSSRLVSESRIRSLLRHANRITRNHAASMANLWAALLSQLGGRWTTTQAITHPNCSAVARECDGSCRATFGELLIGEGMWSVSRPIEQCAVSHRSRFRRQPPRAWVASRWRGVRLAQGASEAAAMPSFGQSRTRASSSTCSSVKKIPAADSGQQMQR